MPQKNPTEYRNGKPVCGHSGREIQPRDNRVRYPCGQLALARCVSFAPASIQAWDDHFAGRKRVVKQSAMRARP